MTHLPLSFCISSLISSISGATSKSLPPADILHLPSLLRLQQPGAFQSASPEEASHTGNALTSVRHISTHDVLAL